MLFISFILSSVINLFIWVFILRLWMQWARADFYNPLAQAVVKITQPLLKPLRRFIPSLGPIDTASLLLAWLGTFLGLILQILLKSQPLPNLFSLALVAFIQMLIMAGTLIFWVLFLTIIMSWINPNRNPVNHMLFQLTEPFLAPIRRILPSFGVLDFSPMVFIFILYALYYLAIDIIYWIPL